MNITVACIISLLILEIRRKKIYKYFKLLEVHSKAHVIFSLYNINFFFSFSSFINFVTASKSSTKKFDTSPFGCTGRNTKMHQKRLNSMI